MVNPIDSDDTKLNSPEAAEGELNPEAMADELASLREKVKEYKDSYLRALAEADNIRRRAQDDVKKANLYSIERLARSLLEVGDCLEKALQASTEDSALKEGVEMTLKLFMDTLDKFGIQQIDPLGEAFNPQQQEAISLQPAASQEEANTVLVVAQKGFLLHERVLRPARVVVAGNFSDSSVNLAESSGYTSNESSKA